MILLSIFLKGIFEGKGTFKKDAIIIINPGTNAYSLGNTLYQKGLIRNAKEFILYLRWKKQSYQIKSGEYKFFSHASIKDITDIIISEKTLKHYFTVPEGASVFAIFKSLQNNKILVGKLPEKFPSEGCLIADTIQFIYGTSRKEILNRLQEEQERLVETIWNHRDLDIPINNKNDLVIIASIIEKETNLSKEKPHVASVFYNRLKKNMRLQSDATVLYGIFKGKDKPLNRPIYRSDLIQKNQYNTYWIFGLPPSPIGNPGKEALIAAANPLHTSDFYFVATGKGGHVFSKKFKDHILNVKKLRKFLKEHQDDLKNSPSK